MVTSVYVAASDAASGKSVVTLGLMEALTGRLGGAGVFRPAVRAGERDPVVELLRGRYPVPGRYADCVGVTYDDVHADPDDALATIVEQYHALARRCPAVVVVGTDYTDVGAPTEFAFNARVAVNLASPILLVVNGLGRTGHQVASAAELARTELFATHATLLGVVANRVAPEEVPVARQELAGLAVPAYALPEIPRLSAPTVDELMAACEGELLLGERDQLGREASGVLIAAMTLPNVLDHLTEGAAVITPGDRVAILLGLLAAHRSGGFPALSGIFMSGGFAPDQQTKRLVEGLAPRLPVILTRQDTYATASALAATRGRITANAHAKIADALGVFERNVNTPVLMDRLAVARSTAVTPVMFEYELVERARSARSRIVLPEGTEERILRAADILLRRDVAGLTLLGDPEKICAQAAELGLDLTKADVVDPSGEELRERFAEEYARLRAHKGVSAGLARDIVTDVSYFGTMMVHLGLADGMVSGAAHTTAHTIRPAFEIIRTEPGTSIVSSVFFMCLADRVLVYGDCAVNPDPDAEHLADIAISSAATAARFGVEPRIAMLSYSTGESGTGSDVDKVREATACVRSRTGLPAEGPIQYDAAVDAGVARTKLPDSEVAGRATVFIVPDLNTGNNVYKAVQRSAGAVAVGPVLQGLRRPVNDLSRGATVQDIVNTVAITAVQAQAHLPAGPGRNA